MKNFIFLLSAFSLFQISADAKIVDEASEIRPLLIGDNLPQVELQDMSSKNIQLSKYLDGKKAVIVFYRGGWCPYCNTQLQELRDITTKIQKLGYQLIAISPDKPEELQKNREKNKIDFELLSDSKAKASEAFGIAFKVDKETQKKYKDYGIDLQKASGEKHGSLPVPSVFLINKEGKIVFSYVNPDYKVRLKKEVLLAAARAYSE